MCRLKWQRNTLECIAAGMRGSGGFKKTTQGKKKEKKREDLILFFTYIISMFGNFLPKYLMKAEWGLKNSWRTLIYTFQFVYV